jgi:hypothetical protein
MPYFNLNLFRGSRMVQIGDYSFTGTKQGAIDRAADLLVSEGLSKVSVESKSGLIVAVIKPEKTRR